MCTQVGKITDSLAGTASAHRLLVHHVAKRLGISRRMVRHLAQKGELRGHKAGRKIWQFVVTDIEAFRTRREARYV